MLLLVKTNRIAENGRIVLWSAACPVYYWFLFFIHYLSDLSVSYRPFVNRFS